MVSDDSNLCDNSILTLLTLVIKSSVCLKLKEHLRLLIVCNYNNCPNNEIKGYGSIKL